jgi:biopolymer transport protein ExbB
MLSHLFLGMSLLGAEWVLYLLLILSILSITLIVERWRFYSSAQKGIADFRKEVRTLASTKRWSEASAVADRRMKSQETPDLEVEMTSALLKNSANAKPEVLNELAQDAVMRARVSWEKNLSILATIGSNAPFVGLFGTVLGIIKAFHDLSQTANTGASMVTSGISEALVATATGLLVAIPAVVAFNIFQRRVKAALTEAEALKSYLIGEMSK